MPTVDFTLEDIKQLMEQTIDQKIDQKVPVIMEKIVAEQFMSFWDKNLGPVLDEMQEDITVIKDTVKDHSFRIARLEGRLKRS